MGRCGNRGKCGQYSMIFCMKMKSVYLSAVFIASLHCGSCVVCMLGLTVPLRGKAVVVFLCFSRKTEAERSWGLTGFRKVRPGTGGGLDFRNFSAEV